LLLLASAGLFSPYGIFGKLHEPLDALIQYILLFDYYHGRDQLKDAINEFAPSFKRGTWQALLIVGYAWLAFKVQGWRRLLVLLPQYLAALASLCLALSAIKFLPLFALSALPLAAAGSKNLFAKLDTWLRSKQLILRSSASLLLAAVLIMAVYYCPLINDNSHYMLEALPLKACTKLAALDLKPKAGRSHVRVLTHFDYGGWCRWAVYQANPALDYRVTTDGRTQFIDAGEIMKSFDLYRLNNDWAQTLTSWDPDAALVDKHRALAQFLARAPNLWTLRYEDEKFAIFTPKRPG
jgi:hypothetical protein